MSRDREERERLQAQITALQEQVTALSAEVEKLKPKPAKGVSR
jgi:prefoldin subunit 5